MFRFGFGLSYTTFKVSNLKLDKASIDQQGTVQVSADVENTGKTPGEEVVQLYIHQRAGSAVRPVRELKGFQKVLLTPGEKKTLQFSLGPQELRFWSPVAKEWVVEPETFDVWVGEDISALEHAAFQVRTSHGQTLDSQL